MMTKCSKISLQVSVLMTNGPLIRLMVSYFFAKKSYCLLSDIFAILEEPFLIRIISNFAGQTFNEACFFMIYHK